MKKILPIALSVAVLLIAVSISYYFFFLLPNQHNEKAENTLLVKQTFESCMEEAERNYNIEKNGECLQRTQSMDCTLPPIVTADLTEARKNSEDTCLKLYKEGYSSPELDSEKVMAENPTLSKHIISKCEELKDSLDCSDITNQCVSLFQRTGELCQFE